ncbi:hypothetical protein DPMN_062367 [Dreissena polymorpha]|uniref:Uncharacterized protein n=1 Tax=Dreissena polymorpha TaxID=45954 RepID=A0A9D4C9L4_DREPO|nr:hypothetical protein DPMN_062357 [Dreissena polymorpha]KAH3719530.1 hypothetical protein DPMN_062367 [Dreissena polymorpha]
MLHDQTLAKKNDETKTLGFKQVNNFVMMLLCTNSSGNHQTLLICKFTKLR